MTSKNVLDTIPTVKAPDAANAEENQPDLASGGAASTRNETDAKAESKINQAALHDLLSPVSSALWVGRVMAVISAALRVFPYVALVGIGNELMGSLAANTDINRGAIQNWIFLLIGTFCGGLLAYLIGLLVTHIADIRLAASIQQRMIDRLAKALLTWFGENTSGHVRKVLQDDVKSLHMLVAHRPVDSLMAALLPLFCSIYAFIIDWRLGILVIFPVAVYMVIYGMMMRGMDTKTVELDNKLDQVSAAMIEFIKGIQVVKTFGITGKAHQRYAQSASEACDFMEEWNRPMVRAASLTAALVSTPVIVLLVGAVGGWMVQNGWVTPVEVIAAGLIAIALPDSINLVAQMMWNYQLAGSAAKRITDLIALSELPAPNKSAAQPVDASVEFKAVSVSYGETKALQNVSLRCPQGTTTALMGPSGAGKSTLAKLAARFLDPDEGSVTIGGVDLKDLSRKDLYSRVSFVLQDVQLLKATVRENIALARPEATEAEIVKAAQQAQIHEEIMALPKGYDSVIGEGMKPSGGQQQRISVARALVLDAPILILDEAAAMVDPECEAQIQAAINQLTMGRTVIVIDHRPSSVQNVDQIALLERGKLVASGSHRELKANELYRRLWEASGANAEEAQQ
ncbi:MAG: ABC transporter ATP-binding protein [Mobiluncus porci]|uniref:ABC transporter ATP-binding protein n=1 Tax=Mobiluncus porci TaxID=2652278 RepID=UPI0023F52FEA|nr:ABC transporter ATP-binding protein [Mobiluncus porci]MDD7542032.1 ABC transporter ATP-binding protein [Mobiluncus porci]MDY5747654.1 ABC transporter ATP-binding protein [Mobiluncus porci]